VCPLGESVVRTFPPRDGNVVFNLDDLDGAQPFSENTPCIEDEGDPTLNVLVGVPGGVTVPEPSSDPLPIDRLAPVIMGVLRRFFRGLVVRRRSLFRVRM
jgi:hypothetical protein